MTEKEQSEVMLLCGIIHDIVENPKCCDAIKALQIVEKRIEKLLKGGEVYSHYATTSEQLKS
jgi:hypothetical protein